MKKVLSVIIAFVLVFACLTACGTNTEAKGVKVINVPLTEEEYAYGVSKDDPELLAKLNDYIAKIKADGTMDAIMNVHFGGGTATGIASAEPDSTKDQLTIVTHTGFVPFEYLEGDLYYGIDIEIMKGFADSLGKELVIQNIDFESVLNNVDAGYADIAAAGLTKNAEREKQVSFSTSYYNASQMVIVKADDTRFDACKTKEDVEAILNGLDSSKTIGCQNGTTGKSYIAGDEAFGFAGLKAIGKGYENGALAVQDLINGNLDCVIIDEAPAKAICAKMNATA